MKKFITLSMLFMATAIFAQEETTEPAAEPAGLTVSGSVDVYAQSYIGVPDYAGANAFGTSFADGAGFALGMANVIMSYEGAKTGVVVDLAYGPRATAAVSLDANSVVNQAYAYWNVSDKVTLTMGAMNTFLGYEVISPTGNFNYSTSYLFSSGPFSHLGLKADFAISDDFSLMAAVLNPTDYTSAANTYGDYALGLQLGYKGQFLNIYHDGGVYLGTIIDYTGGFDVTEEFFLGINAAYQTSEVAADVNAGYYGAALYPQYAISEDFSLGFRGELFGYHTDADGAADLPSVFAATLTGSYTVENLTIKPEVRLDSWSNSMPYLDDEGAPTESLSAISLAAIYSF